MQRAAQRRVGLQLVQARLRESTADHQAVDVRQPGVVQRVDGHELGAGRFERREVVGVIEAERAVAGDADAQPAALRTRRSRIRACSGRDLGWQGTGRSRQPKHALEVHLRADDAADLVHARVGVADLGAGHQAQMALGHREARVFGDRAEHGHVGVVLDRRAQLGFVACAPHAD